jgi:hypothetical protein
VLRRVSAYAFWLWAVVCLFLVASLMVTHTYALPAPAPQDLKVDAHGRWLVLHVLYSRCRCSQRILEHLFARKALPDAAERLVLVGADEGLERRARAAGFTVEVLTPEQLPQRYVLSAVPALAVISPESRVAYLGGYTERKQGPEIEDLKIYERVRAGTRMDALPLFGCAVSEALRDRLDPLSVRSLLLGE